MSLSDQQKRETRHKNDHEEGGGQRNKPGDLTSGNILQAQLCEAGCCKNVQRNRRGNAADHCGNGHDHTQMDRMDPERICYRKEDRDQEKRSRYTFHKRTENEKNDRDHYEEQSLGEIHRCNSLNQRAGYAGGSKDPCESTRCAHNEEHDRRGFCGIQKHLPKIPEFNGFINKERHDHCVNNGNDRRFRGGEQAADNPPDNDKRKDQRRKRLIEDLHPGLFPHNQRLL